MYHKKKIALFISHIYGAYQSTLSQGILAQAASYGYKVEVYTTSDGEDLGDYSRGEASILKVPNWSDIDGVIFASGTYTDHALRSRICDMLLSRQCTVVEITEDSPAFPNITLENNITAGTLTAHLIDVHHASDICYLGCAGEALYSDRRQKAFLTVMQQHALSVPAENIYSCTETPEDYKAALYQFCQSRSSLPDAIVCYNDRVALGFLMAALEEGYHVPEDFAITGCDNIREGQSIVPPLTTVSFPTYQLGTTAVDSLFARLQGHEHPVTTVFAEPVYGGSCGCSYTKNHSGSSYICQLSDHIADLERSTFRSMRMSAVFSHILDIDDGMDALEKYVGEIENCSEFYLCLYSDWDTLSDPVLTLAASEDMDGFSSAVPSNTMLLKLGMKNGRRLPECSFQKNSLLPEFLENSSDASYIVSPLFFEDRSFGYIAMAFEKNKLNYPFKLVPFIMNITQLLSNLCDTKRTRLLTEHLETLYLRDVLTGLYNHHGFDQQEDHLLKNIAHYQYIHALIFDLDMLKTINDRFGHEAGDFALKTIGQAIANASLAHDICARFSGDEFYCLLPSNREDAPLEFIRKVNLYLAHCNLLNDRPYNVSTSGGFSTAPCSLCHTKEDIRKLFSEADEHMYETKKSKIKQVLKDMP